MCLEVQGELTKSLVITFLKMWMD